MANIADEFPINLSAGDLPPNGTDVQITHIFQKDAINDNSGLPKPTWHCKMDQFPGRLLKCTPGVGAGLHRILGSTTEEWLNQWIHVSPSTNKAPGGEKYIVVDEANQQEPPETPPVDLEIEPPPEEEGE